VARSKARGPVALSADGPREIVHLGRLNGFVATPSLPKIQAAHIVSRFGVAPNLAATGATMTPAPETPDPPDAAAAIAFVRPDADTVLQEIEDDVDLVMSIALGVRRGARFRDIAALREALKALRLSVVETLRVFNRLEGQR